MYQKSCVENTGYFYLNNERKKYIPRSVSPSQYKPVENTDVYVHITAS